MYTVVATLRESDRALLHRAVDPQGIPVLLEVLRRPALLSPVAPSDVEERRLANEYEIARRLTGWAVLRPLALTWFEGRVALVRADPGGVSLDRLVGPPLEIGRFLRLGASAAAALGRVHESGVIHKDIKPENLFLDAREGAVRITGFGIATRLPREQALPSGGPLIEGTLAYMSPEQTGRMNRALDRRTDLYSLGVTLYELLTGGPPFAPRDPLEAVHCHLARVPLEPAQLVPGLPAMVSRIVCRLLAKAPEDRYQSAAGLRADLDRCLHTLHARGSIEDFTLGEHDTPDRLQVPHRLHGRDRELATLQECFAQVMESRRPVLCLVSGQSGIGKSMLVHQLEQSVLRERGRFLATKADEARRSVPYSTSAGAIDAFVTDVLGDSDQGFAGWRQRLTDALAGEGRIVLDLVPRLELIVGPQPPVAELPPREAELRFGRVFQRLTGAVTGTDPVVVFLDDLQWADPGSLRLAGEALASAETGRLLLIGAYRDDEVNGTQTLPRLIANARAAGTPVRELALGPLELDAVIGLVAETLQASRQHVEPLARLIHDKTGGSPLFIGEFLERLHRDGLLSFDQGQGAWRWDVAEIATQEFTRNVVDLLVGKVNRLSPGARAALELAACVGGPADPAMLAALSDVAEAAIRQDLLEAVEAGLVVPQGGRYRFVHDRVRQAAYQRQSPEGRAAAHLRIGRFLLGRAPPSRLEGEVFEVVDHLNLASSLIANGAQRRQLAELDLLAGQRARGSHAWASAADYFAAGTALLDPGAWETDYSLALGLHLGCAECAAKIGDPDRAARMALVVKARARTTLDRAAAYRALQEADTVRGDHRAIRDHALECLALLGVPLPARPSHQDVVAARAALDRRMEGRSIESLVDLPPMSHPEARAALAQRPLSYQADEHLLRLQVVRMVELGLEHGAADELVTWLGMYALVLAGTFEDHASARRFARTALDLAQRRNARYELPAAELLLGLIEYWTDPVDACQVRLRQALESAREVGHAAAASATALYVLLASVARGAPLAESATRAEEMLPFCRVVATSREGLRIHRQLVRCLQGQTRSLSSFDDDEFDQRRFEAGLTPETTMLACWYQVSRLRALYLAGDHAGAHAAARAAAAVIGASTGRFCEHDLHFYGALAVLALLERAGESRPALEAELAAHQRKLRLWAEVNPGTFGAGHALVSAEVARVAGKPEEAAPLYEESVRAAQAIQMMAQEALGYELASDFYRTRGFDLIADSYLREAHARYVRWGAFGKVAQLESLYPALVAPPALLAPGVTIATSSQHLDVLSVVRASQAISGEVVLESLLRTLMEVTLAQSGARRACLVLSHDDGPWLEAEALVHGAGTEVRLTRLRAVPRFSAELPGQPTLPLSLLQYVWHTGEVVTFDASVERGRLASDDYFATHRPRSVLGLPIRGRGAVMGALYLENDMVAGAFTPARLTVLELLATQSAISLENARLLEREHAGRAAAEEAEQRATFLAEAGSLLTESLHHETVLNRLARLAVRRLADWCVIDLVVEGQIRRVAGAHADPVREPLLQELRRRFPPRWDSPHPASEVLRTGRSLLLSTLSPGRRRMMVVDPEHDRLVAALGAASGLVVPLVARGRVLGTISLASSQSGRFGHAELEVSEELGRRAGIAIDNAHLHAQTQEAVRLRDEFLTVASHELNTPMAALALSLDGISSLPALQREEADVLAKMVGIAGRQGRRLGRLIEELLDVTRIDRGVLRIEPQTVELGALMRDVLARYEPELTRARCTLSVSCAESVIGRWDPLRLEQVATNLLSNAVKFGADRPIEVRVHHREGRARLSVTDHGIGIEPSQQSRIFERFVRAVSVDHYGGLGLGLYVCRRIVEAHGGTIGVESEPGRGATFMVELPLESLPGRMGDYLRAGLATA